MKKRYLLLSAMIVGSSVLFAQDISPKIGNAKAILKESNYTPKLERLNDKAYLDTIYHESFNTNLNGWTVGHNTSQAFDWKWDDKAPGGSFTNEPALSSSSGPGFISLPMDAYNTPLPATPVTMDAWITSPAIPINPAVGSVLLHFEHYQRYCCSGSNELVVEISLDGTTFNTFDATNGRGPNSASPNGETIEINLTKELAYADTCYIRFRATGSTHYFWMVDDVTLLEGPKNAMSLENFEILYHPDSFLIFPNYYSVPQSQVSPIAYRGMTFNSGANTQTNVMVTADVYHASKGYVYSESALVNSAILASQRDTTDIDARKFLVMDTGKYTQHVTVSSDSVNQNPLSQRTLSSILQVTDTVFGVDKGTFTGNTGASDYVGGDADGSQMLQLYVLEKPALATSISYYMPNDTSADGVEMKLHIFPFNEDPIIAALAFPSLTAAQLQDSIAEAIGPEVGGSPINSIQSVSNVNSWVTVPLIPAVNLPKGQYLVGFEQITGANVGNAMSFGRDQDSETHMEGFSCYIFLNGASSPHWGTAPRVPGIHLNLGNSTVGVNENIENNIGFAVAPNPNSGEFTLKVKSQSAVNYTLNVRNMIGQIVYTEEISVNGVLNKQMKLSNLDKGIYFVSLENGTEKLVKKVVLK